MFSLESPHRGDSNEYTQYTIFNTQKKISLSYFKSAAIFFQGTQGLKKQPLYVRRSSVYRTLGQIWI